MSKPRKALVVLAIVLALVLLGGIYLLTGEVRVIGPLGHIDVERSCYQYDPKTEEVGPLSSIRLSGWFWTWKDTTDKNECNLDPLEVEALPGFAPDTSLASTDGPFVNLYLDRFVFADTEDAFAALDGHSEHIAFYYDRSTGLSWARVSVDVDTWYLIEAPSPEAVPEAYEDFLARYHDAW